MRPEQQDLFDTTPLGLWELPQNRTGQPEATPEPTPTVQTQQASPRPAPAPCLQCGKPARVLTPGRAAVYCSKTCLAKSQASLERFNARLAKTHLAGDDNQTLFQE